jgi:hypothetical protein
MHVQGVAEFFDCGAFGHHQVGAVVDENEVHRPESKT